LYFLAISMDRLVLPIPVGPAITMRYFDIKKSI
jgi:hypothetical protein